MVTLLTCHTESFAASDFSNNPALNSIFATLEKTFLEYKRDEVLPLRSLGEIITQPNQPRTPRTSKKMTDAQIKGATQKALNDIRVAVEIKEEALGGLTPEDYQIIIKHFNEVLFFGKSSKFSWDCERKAVQLLFNAEYRMNGTLSTI
jgi:hypothetical protein